MLPADQELNEIPFFQQCLMGICETAASKLYEVLVIMLDASDLSRVKRVVQENKVDGIIVTRAITNDPVIRYLESEHVRQSERFCIPGRWNTGKQCICTAEKNRQQS
nr:hypothetical protein [uncultured Eubacterium sp.]